MLYLLLLATTATGFAEEGTPQTTVKLQDLSVTMPYGTRNTQIIREETPTEVRVTLTDKETGEHIRTTAELKSPQKTQYIKTMYEEYTANSGSKVRLYADFWMYSSGSFAEILDVQRTYWQIESEEGWVLAGPHSGYQKMSPNKFEVYGEALIELESTIVDKQLLSSSTFGGLYFNRWKTVSSKWYEREIISGGFVYEINR